MSLILGNSCIVFCRHLYALGNEAVSHVIQENKDQCIIIRWAKRVMEIFRDI